MKAQATQKAAVTVSVNGVPLHQYIERERSSEIECFYLSELKSMRRASRRPCGSSENRASNSVRRVEVRA